jgi:non-ribosomal peptide synthetase component E (peptide arylation enzyme)
VWSHWNIYAHREASNALIDSELLSLHQAATQYYATFQDDPSFILPRFNHLFTQRPLSHQLATAFDTIKSWVLSVETAVHATAIHITQQRHLSSRTGNSTFNP